MINCFFSRISTSLYWHEYFIFSYIEIDLSKSADAFVSTLLCFILLCSRSGGKSENVMKRWLHSLKPKTWTVLLRVYSSQYCTDIAHFFELTCDPPQILHTVLSNPFFPAIRSARYVTTHTAAANTDQNARSGEALNANLLTVQMRFLYRLV